MGTSCMMDGEPGTALLYPLRTWGLLGKGQPQFEGLRKHPEAWHCVVSQLLR